MADGLVIFGTDVHNSRNGEPAGVTALDAATGTERWNTVTAPTQGEGATGPGCGDVWGSPSVDSGARLVFVGTGNCTSSPDGYGRFAEAIRTLEADLRGLWPQMQDLLENQLSADLQKEARQSVPDFAGQRRELSESIQTAFIDILAGKSLKEQVARSFAQTSIWLRVVTGIIMIAVAVAVFVKIPNVGRASIVVAGIAAIVAGILAFNHRRKVLSDYERQLNPKRAEFTQTLEKQFAKAIDSFCAEMAKKFRSLNEICQTRMRRYQPWSERASELETKLAELKPRIG